MSTKRKDNGNGDHPTPDSTTKEKITFYIGDEVLLQRKDGNFYLGTVVKIDVSRDQCQVKFGDNTETWSSCTRLTKLSAGLGVMCVKCKVSRTDTNNDIAICDKCLRGYHQKCHYPPISDEFLGDDSKWECMKCCEGEGRRSLPLRKSTGAPPQPPPLSPSTPSPQPVAHSKPLPQNKPSPQPKSIPQPTKTPAPTPKLLPQPKQLPQGTGQQKALPPQQKVPPPLQKASLPQQKASPPQPKPAQVLPVKATPPPPKPSPPPPKPSPTPPKASPPPPKPSPPPPKASPPPPKPSPPPPKPSPPPPKVSPPPPKASPPRPSPLVQPLPVVQLLPIQLPPAQPPPTQPPPDPIPPKPSPPPTPPSTPTQNFQPTLSVATDVHKKKLPYNLNDLHWDMHHRSNKENKYCYCGGPGKWFLKMLQCGRCRQWFHGRCLSSLRYPLFYGDRFYVFLCTHCNSGKEFLRRLELKWIDLVHLAAFNLTLKNGSKYHDVDDDILKFINSNWNILQLSPKILELSDESERREMVLSVLIGDTNRFKCNREMKCRKTKWGLKKRVPPLTPVFSLPPNKPLSDQVLSESWNNSARLKFLPPPPRNALSFKPEDDIDLANLDEELPGVDILDIDAFFIRLPKGVPANGHNVCIKSSTPIYSESRAIKRRIQEQGVENDRLRKARKAKRSLRSSLVKEEVNERQQDLPPTPPSSESNPEVATAQPDTSGDETSSRGTLDAIIPPPADFEGRNNPFLPLAPVLRPIKRRLSEKDIRVTSTGEVKRRKVRRNMKHSGRGVEGNGRGRLRKLKSSTPTTSPVKSQTISFQELRSSVNQYFGALNRIASGEKFCVRAKRISLEGRTQYLVDWGRPS